MGERRDVGGWTRCGSLWAPAFAGGFAIARLSRAFGGQKKASLSRALLAAGYDGIVTVEQTPRRRHTSEIVQMVTS